MKTIDIKFTRPKTLSFPILSWMIRLFTWSSFSHVLLDLNEQYIFHAHINNVTFEPRGAYLRKVKVLHSFRLYVPDEVFSDVYRNCRLVFGKQKGYLLQLLGILLVMPFRLFGIYFRNPFQVRNESSITCAQLVALIATYSDLKITAFNESGIPFNVMTERDCYNIVKQLSTTSGWFSKDGSVS